MNHELYLAERLDQQQQREAEVIVETQQKMRQIARFQAIRDKEVDSNPKSVGSIYANEIHVVC